MRRASGGRWLGLAALVATMGGSTADVAAAEPRATVAPRLSSAPEPTTSRPRPDPKNVRKSIRKFRRGGFALLGVAGAGLAAAVGLQIGRGVALRRCALTGNADSRACKTSDRLESQLANNSTKGMAIMVAGSAGAGGMFGNALAARDVQLRGEEAKSRSFSKFFGVITIGLSSAWVLGRNLHFRRAESRCDGDLRCIANVRPQRWLANDIATLGISAGAGFLGFAFAYEKQGKALMKLRALPIVSRGYGGVSVSTRF